ncbi:MAG: cbb3-type cytochrome c oxidase subunit I, partial [Chitinophagaceae bacterium]
GHLAFWGAYGMIVFSIISYTMPNLTGRKLFDSTTGLLAFWLSNIGMLGMTVAFGVAGVAQVYLERKVGIEFGDVQKEIEVHFFILVICATMFATGVSLFIYEFIKFGRPTDEAIITTQKV